MHLLLAMFNAMQPGVFALSGWDLCGMLTLQRSQVSRLIRAGDTRWIHRAAYDLMNYRPQATESASGIPRGTCLYGSLPDQLSDPESFVSRLRQMLTIRTRYGIATGVQLDVPPVTDKAMLVMVHRLDTGQPQVAVLNFADRPIVGRVTSEHLPLGGAVVDMFTDRMIAGVDRDRSFAVSLAPHQGMSLLVVDQQYPKVAQSGPSS